jgi:hypothetical protein
VNLSGANEHFSQQLTPVFDALREQGAPVMQTRANGLLKGMSVESRDIGRFPQANSFRQGLSPHIAGLQLVDQHVATGPPAAMAFAKFPS